MIKLQSERRTTRFSWYSVQRLVRQHIDLLHKMGEPHCPTVTKNVMLCRALSDIIDVFMTPSADNTYLPSESDSKYVYVVMGYRFGDPERTHNYVDSVWEDMQDAMKAALSLEDDRPLYESVVVRVQLNCACEVSTVKQLLVLKYPDLYHAWLHKRLYPDVFPSWQQHKEAIIKEREK